LSNADKGAVGLIPALELASLTQMPHQISNLAADMLATQCNGQAKFSGPDWWGPSTWELGDYPPSWVGSICVEI